MRRWLWKYRLVIYALAMLFLFYAVVPPLFQAGFFGRYDAYIDMNSGKLRYRHILWGRVISERIIDTGFSTLVQKYTLVQEPPVWRYMSGETQRLGHIIPPVYGDGKYGQYMSWCDDATQILALLKLPESNEKEEVAKLLRLLQAEDYDGLRSEVNSLWDLGD